MNIGLCEYWMLWTLDLTSFGLSDFGHYALEQYECWTLWTLDAVIIGHYDIGLYELDCMNIGPGDHWMLWLLDDMGDGHLCWSICFQPLIFEDFRNRGARAIGGQAVFRVSIDNLSLAKTAQFQQRATSAAARAIKRRHFWPAESRPARARGAFMYLARATVGAWVWMRRHSKALIELYQYAKFHDPSSNSFDASGRNVK